MMRPPCLPVESFLANPASAMTYEGVDYVVRASLGRDQWTILIYFPNNPEVKPRRSNLSERETRQTGQRVEGLIVG
jgi:hypothetical protein